MDVSPKQVVPLRLHVILLENSNQPTPVVWHATSGCAVVIPKPLMWVLLHGIPSSTWLWSSCCRSIRWVKLLMQMDKVEVRPGRWISWCLPYHSVVQKLRLRPYSQRTLVKVGDVVEKGDFIADGPSMEKGRNGTWTKGQSLPTWHGKGTTSRMPLSWWTLEWWCLHICSFGRIRIETRDTKLGPERNYVKI